MDDLSQNTEKAGQKQQKSKQKPEHLLTMINLLEKNHALLPNWPKP